jgi:hypothetical protein
MACLPDKDDDAPCIHWTWQHPETLNPRFVLGDAIRGRLETSSNDPSIDPNIFQRSIDRSRTRVIVLKFDVCLIVNDPKHLPAIDESIEDSRDRP